MFAHNNRKFIETGGFSSVFIVHGVGQLGSCLMSYMFGTQRDSSFVVVAVEEAMFANGGR